MIICLDSNKYGIMFASVVIDGNIGIGDCLTVTSNSQRSIFYWASRCDLQLFQICSNGEYLVDYLSLENLILKCPFIYFFFGGGGVFQ